MHCYACLAESYLTPRLVALAILKEESEMYLPIQSQQTCVQSYLVLSATPASTLKDGLYILI